MHFTKSLCWIYRASKLAPTSPLLTPINHGCNKQISQQYCIQTVSSQMKINIFEYLKITEINFMESGPLYFWSMKILIFKWYITALMVVIGLRQYVELNPRSVQYTLSYHKVLYPLEKYRENCTYFWHILRIKINI